MIVLAVLARAAIIIAAFAVARGSASAALFGAIAAAVLYALERAVSAGARGSVEGDLHRMTAEALLRSDVLAAPAALSRVVYEGAFHALQLLVGVLPSLAADLWVSLAALPILAVTLPLRLVVVATIALAMAATGFFFVRRVTQGLEQRSRDAYQALADTIAIAIEGRLELVARGGEDDLLSTLEAQIRAYQRQSVRAAWASAILGRAPLAAAVCAVGLAVLADATSRSMLESAILVHALVLTASLRPVIGAVIGAHGAVRILTFVEPFASLLRLPSRVDVVRPGHIPVPELPTAFEAIGLGFGYDDDACVLSELSFSWKGNEPLVLVGPNGSGKTTLLRLVLGLRPPTTGALRIAGKDLATLDVKSLRRSIAYLPQRPYLGEAHGTVRAAMKLGQANASDEAIRRALERTGVLAMLETRQDDPLAVPVGELSAGQRQRVGFARILLHETAKLVLLDEPDANLDREGVRLVVSLIRELSLAGKMVLVSAHTPELMAVSPRRIELAKVSRPNEMEPSAVGRT